MGTDAENAGSETLWYWDLVRRVAVRAEDRGPGTSTMGPYSSKAEAEHWQERVDERNAQWEEDDEEWEDGGPDADPGPGDAR